MSGAEQSASSPDNIIKESDKPKGDTEDPARRGLMSRISNEIQSSGASDSESAKSHISLSTTKCSVCKVIADAIIWWPEGNDSLRLGSWQGFLDRRQCVCCQMIVRRMKEVRPYQIPLEPTCPIILSLMTDVFWIHSVSGHILCGRLPCFLWKTNVLYRIRITIPTPEKWPGITQLSALFLQRSWD